MMVRMQIQFTEEQATALRAEAARRGISVAAVVRERCEAGASPHASLAEAVQRSRTFHSGRSDVSTNHDDHLADAYYDWHERSDR